MIIQDYPIVEEIYSIYHHFHDVLMGKDTQLLEDFLEIYEESLIQNFCENLKKDFAAVKQAISSSKNSGWVEGLNTKFKTIKRILYGRAKIVNLEKKFRLALYRFKEGQRIMDLLKNQLTFYKLVGLRNRYSALLKKEPLFHIQLTEKY